MRGDEVTVGDVIDYRGATATVVEAWTDQQDAPIRKAPVGCIIEWTDENGTPQRTRLVWPELTASERRRPDQDPAGLSDEQVLARLPDALASAPLEPATDLGV